MGYDDENILIRILSGLDKVKTISVFFCFIRNENYHQYSFMQIYIF